MVPVGRRSRVVWAHIQELALTGVSPCWLLFVDGSMRGTFFWIGLPWRSGMVNGVGAESCRKITHHPPVGQCRRVQRPFFLCRDEMEEVGGEVPVISRPGLPPVGFAGAHYLPAIGSRVRATRPFAWPAPLVLPPSLGARGGIGLQGDGLLDCWT